MNVRPISHTTWNLFLAIIPVVIAFIVFFGVRYERRKGRVHWLIWLPMLVVWFAFLPNSCYLITEWRHYLDNLMRDPDFYFAAKHNSVDFAVFVATSVFYICYSACGLVCFFLSIYPLDVLFKPPWIVRPFVFFLCSLGVYLGLIDRFNSWQIVSHPNNILHAAHQALERPLLLALICCFSVVLWLFYGVFGLTMDGAIARFWGPGRTSV